MTKNELAKELKDKLGFRSEAQAIEVVDGVFQEIEEQLKSGKEVLITGFGVFEIRRHTGRNARNLQTNQVFDKGSFKRPWFRFARRLKAEIGKT